MPRLSILYIKTSLLYLLVGFTFGGAILFQKGTSVFPFAWRLLPSHIEMLLFGWTIQLIMGTAFWILPRFAKLPRRGNERPIWIAYLLLNLGILLVVCSPLLVAPSWFLFAGRLVEGLGVLAFITNAWPRVK